MQNKYKIIIAVIVVIIVATLLTIFSKNYIKNYKRKHARIEVTLVDDLNIEFTEEKHISDFIESINGNITNDYIVDSTKIGENTVRVDFINDENIDVSYEFNIFVKDNIPPVIWMSDSYSTTVGNDINIIEKVMCGDNEDDNPLRKIEGTYDINTER